MSFEDISKTKSECDDYYRSTENGLFEEYTKELNTASSTKLKEREFAKMDEHLSKLFDGDKPLEIKPAQAEAKKEDWLVVMNLGTDFGGECTIEKRTNKLKELAKESTGKDVTIVVQSTIRDQESGNYKLERFAIKNGEIVKLESPKESKGYGTDVEDFLKFAVKNYPSKNLGLILDSHGQGNEGLQGDNGNVSMKGLKDHVKTALDKSGHEKLGFIQFDACLMAQNGVLEATKDIADHVIASAQPQGVTADTAAADNKNLAELLKDSKMSPEKFAEICIEKAPEVQGFETLAHFDMSKYAEFRKSLDGLGVELAKLCQNKDNLEILRKIIAETFQYGSSFRLIGPLPEIFETLIRHRRDGELIAEKRVPSERPGAGDSILNSIPRSLKPLLENSPLGDLFLDRPFESLPPFNRFLGTGKRDLKDFVEKLIAAVEKGDLKDEGGKLSAAAKAVLKEGANLTRGYFGRGNHKGLGGLSVFLQDSPGDHGNDGISTDGGWREFQKLLKEKKP